MTPASRLQPHFIGVTFCDEQCFLQRPFRGHDADEATKRCQALSADSGCFMGTKSAEHFFSGGEGKILKRQGAGVIQLLFS